MSWTSHSWDYNLKKLQKVKIVKINCSADNLFMPKANESKIPYQLNNYWFFFIPISINQSMNFMELKKFDDG